jgi:phosphocarrier protein
MTETDVLIKNQLGLHVRACSQFVRTAAKFKSEVLVSHDGLEVNGKSIMGVMMLAAECGSSILVRTDGSDEAAALEAILELIATGFGET